MLLLVVLSMLTLFMLLGVAYIVSSSRAKEAARAMARLTLDSDVSGMPPGPLLNAVLMRVVRGGGVVAAIDANKPAAQQRAPSPVFESLLADKYGDGTLSGTLSDVAVSGPVVTAAFAPVSGGGVAHPTQLNGRVLTIVEEGRPVTSHRILRAGTAVSGFTVALDLPRTGSAFVAPTSPVRAIVNGREFAGSKPANEAWDGFDQHNPFLACISPPPAEAVRAISTAVVSRPSYGPTGTLVSGTDYDGDLVPDVADNDGDGVPDGVFFDFGLPRVEVSGGQVRRYHASVLVVDLDGRWNVNAHDSLARIISGTGHTQWPAETAVPGLRDAPLGSGYGPPEVNAAKLTRLCVPGTSPVQYQQSGFAARMPQEFLAWRSSAQNTVPGLSREALLPATEVTVSGSTFHEVENPQLFAMVGGPPPVPSSRANYPCRSYAGGHLQGTRFDRMKTSPGYSPGVVRLATTPRLFALEGRYGEVAAAQWLQPFFTGTILASNTTTRTLVRSGTFFAFALPGVSGTDDGASRQNDRRVLDATITSTPSANLGVPPAWWIVGTTSTTGTNFNWTAAPTNRPLPRAIYNSPPDLHGRMKVVPQPVSATGVVPRLAFVKPEWSTMWTTTSATSSTTTGAPTVGTDLETLDDPYELRLDLADSGGWLHDPGTDGTARGRLADNPFTLGELERVLRVYDADGYDRPLRLAAVLGSVGEECRLKCTTESWDTTAIAGDAAKRLFAWLQTSTGTTYGTSPVTGVIGGEVMRGERLDLNRALTGAKPASYTPTDAYYLQRQALFKDLYTLLVALGAAPDAATAQWAANVVEFRDADSTMTPFEFDTEPLDGWDVDNDARTTTGESDRGLVWGAERPEILIAETMAWEDAATGELYISLHRPWNSLAYAAGADAGGSTISIPAEPCDPQFDTFDANGRPLDQVDLGRKSDNAAFGASAYPIWRLRIAAPGQPDAYVRLDQATAAAGVFAAGSVTSAAATPKMAVDSWLCIRGGTSVATFGTGIQQLAITAGGTFRVPGTVGTGDRTATIYLERLADPTSAPDATQWSQDPATAASVPSYRIVDRATVTVVNRSSGPTAPVFKRSRQASGTAAFWKTNHVSGAPAATMQIARLTAGAAPNNPVWFPWPNRPLSSAAELTLVPGGDALAMLEGYAKPAGGTGGIPAAAADVLFDAVHVPTRFAGIHRSWNDTTGGYADLTGIFQSTCTVNQLSAFREPGRVNLNTVTWDALWNAVVAGPLASPVVSHTAAGLVAVPAAAPAESFTRALALNASSGLVQDSDPNLKADLDPLRKVYTASRLANVATIRSNVFAVWITLRESVENDPDDVSYHRAFAIVDRSIPVGFEPGRDHNVRDAVRLWRIIE